MDGLVIADEHKVFAAAVARALESDGYIVLALCHSFPDAITAAARLEPTIVISETCFGGEFRGLDFLPDLRAIWPAPGNPVPALIFLSAVAPAYLIDRARTAGANAFVSKRQSYESLKMAIGATQRRETLFPQTASIPHPSERDVALIKMVALGLTSSEIGAAMGLRQRSVEARLLGLYRSQAVSSRGELVARALRKGWIAMQPEDVTTY